MPVFDARHCIVNLQDVEYFDHAGTKWLVRLMQQTRQRGGKSAIVWSRHEIVNCTIRLARCDKMFQMAPDLETARSLIRQ